MTMNNAKNMVFKANLSPFHWIVPWQSDITNNNVPLSIPFNLQKLEDMDVSDELLGLAIISHYHNHCQENLFFE